MLTRPMVIVVLITLPAGCGPAKQVRHPADWPQEWAGRSVWSTPHANIYAAHAAGAGELDRLTIHVKEIYDEDVHGPTPRPLIVVRDVGEALPTQDGAGILRHSLRYSAEMESDPPDDPEEREEDLEGALAGVQAGAYASGTDRAVLVAIMPLLCDRACLRAVTDLPEEMIAEVDLAIIVPTRSSIRYHTNRLVSNALKVYGIGPIAQLVFAPIVAIAKDKMVDQVALLRDAAIYQYWLFENPDLALEEKRERASAYLERWAGDAEAGGAFIAKAAIDAAGGVSDSAAE